MYDNYVMRKSALNAMEEYQVRRIPVVDDNDQIIGIIAQADVATRTTSWRRLPKWSRKSLRQAQPAVSQR
jgi:CBS-domain-containing membrane protein